MKTLSIFFCFMVLTATLPADWPAWRGPTGDGIASPEASPPLQWSQEKNIVWQTDLPGRGHSSPVVVGKRIYLTTFEEAEKTFSVLCLETDSGNLLWKKELHRGDAISKIHKKNTHASPTIASDGTNLFIVFARSEGIELSCLQVSTGDPVWSVRCGPFQPQYEFGYAPSPCLWKDLIIVSAESKPNGFLVAYDKRTGDEKWRTARSEGTSYSSPIVGRLKGVDQILLSGFLRIDSFDPATGEKVWSAPGPASATCGTLVWWEKEGLVFASGGYPQKATVAVREGKEVWRTSEKSYEQSMLLHEGHLYTFNDGGFALCWDAATGEEKWKERLKGPVSASPILAGGRIYALNEKGTTFVIAPDPNQFRLLATNQLGEEGFATPVFLGPRVFYRTSSIRNGKRVETLFCLRE